MTLEERKILAVLMRYSPGDREGLDSLARHVIEPASPRTPGRSAERYLAYLAGRAALSVGLRALGIEGKVSPDPDFGFLRLHVCAAEGEPVHINVSHTANVAVAVIAQGPIGIDIEATTRDVSRVYERVATPQERDRLGTFCSAHKLPNVCLWSAKEAFSKAVGLGMKFGLRDFEIILDGSPPFQARTKLSGPVSIASPAVLFESRQSFMISFCGERRELAKGIQWLVADASGQDESR